MKRLVRNLARVTLCIVSILTIASALSACGEKEDRQREPDLLLGFSQVGSESAWRVGNTKDIVQQAENYGISLMFEDAKQQQENQIAAIRRFIAYRVDTKAGSLSTLPSLKRSLGPSELSLLKSTGNKTSPQGPPHNWCLLPWL